MATLDDMSREDGWYDRRYTAMQARIEDLEDKCEYLSDALTEAIAELDCVVHTEYMSPKKAEVHREWMAWLRSALPKEAEHGE